MQDEINEKVVSMSIRLSKETAKLTEETLKQAMRSFLEGQERQGGGTHGHKEARTADGTVIHKGKQTVAHLMEQNQGLSNIEITDGNIKSFERIARKYSIDFALKKDKTADPPKYIVFFKGKDVDVITQAFKEYSAKEMDRDKKPSIKKLLTKALDLSKGDRERERQKTKDRGQTL